MKSAAASLPLLLLVLAACDTGSTATDTGSTDPLPVEALACNEAGVNTSPFTVAQALTTLTADHGRTADYAAGTTTATIALAGTSVAVTGTGASASGSTVTITAAGTYRIAGNLSDGQIVVNTADTAAVKLVLDGVSVANADDAALLVAKGKRTVLLLADGTTNTFTDGATYPSGADQNAAIWSKGNLSIGGTGTLTVVGRFEDGIATKDGLVVQSGTINVNAVDDGIRGKDYLVVNGGTFAVTAGGDAFKGSEDEDAALGYVLLRGGSGTLTGGGDAVSAETDALLAGGTFTLRAGGGSSATGTDTLSHKGVKAGTRLVMDGGTLAVDTRDDGLHANGALTVNGGSATIATGDDGVHTDGALTVNAGTIIVTKSYEGVEGGAANMAINGGTIRIVSSDDGLNLAGSGDTRPGSGASAYTVRIAAGRIAINASGDGLDANGSVAMSGGCLFVQGPTANNNAAIDFDGTFAMTGGVLVATGSAGMAQAPTASASTQRSVLLRLSSTKAAGTLFRLQTSDGTGIVTFAPSKAYQSVVVSSPALASGTSYDAYFGGSATGTATDGVYEGGTTSGGSLGKTFTLASTTTTVTL